MREHEEKGDPGIRVRVLYSDMHSWPFLRYFSLSIPYFRFAEAKFLLGALIHDDGDTGTKRVVIHAKECSVVHMFLGTQWITPPGRQSLEKQARKKKGLHRMLFEWRENDVSVQGG